MFTKSDFPREFKNSEVIPAYKKEYPQKEGELRVKLQKKFFLEIE